MTFATTKSAVPGLGYRRELADKVGEYSEWNLQRMAKSSLDDPDFCPAMPESDREHAAQRIAQRHITALMGAVLFVLASAIQPTPAYAMVIDGGTWTPRTAAAIVPIEHTCIDREELASVMLAEGGAQPLDTQISIMQIVAREADSRGITVCALTRQTNFVSVRHFADAHPNSWTARQFAHPQSYALELASDVLAGRLEDRTGGLGHWDGSADGMRIIFRP